MRLALGTAQFGLSYGVANEFGQVTPSEVKKIFSLAQRSGVDMLDTAIAYGNSESIIGEQDLVGLNITTKLPKMPEDLVDINLWVNDHIQASLRRLGVENIYGLLLHRPYDLHGKSGAQLMEILQELKSRRLVRKIGVSIYGPTELESLLRIKGIDLVQAPLSLIDRRLFTSGWLDRLHNKGVEIHTRSAFLQGLLLMRRNAIPVKFEKWSGMWDQWNKVLMENPLVDPVSLCLNYPLSFPQVSKVIVGVNSVEHLKKIIHSSTWKAKPRLNLDFLASEDEELVVPSNWDLLQ